MQKKVIKPKESTCGIIIISDDKYLICRATNCVDKVGRDVWGFPKGRQDYGESLEDTAIRETREETGLSFNKDNIQYYCSYFHKGRVVVWFIVDCDSLCIDVDVNELACESMVDNKDYPEMDAYMLVEKKDLTSYLFNHMANIVDDLPENPSSDPFPI